MTDWSFLTTHAEVLLCIAHDPGIRLRDIGAAVGITERRAYSIVADLATVGYVVKERDGRRNRYQLQPDLPLGNPIGREGTIGELLAWLLDEPDAHTAPANGARGPDGRDGRVLTPLPQHVQSRHTEAESTRPSRR